MLFESTVPVFVKGLRNLLGVMGKGVTFAEGKKIDMDVLMQARLAPDMFPLHMQILIACETAKGTTANLTGKEAPMFEDKQATLATARARIEHTLAFLNSLSSKDFQGAETRKCTTNYWNGKWMPGQDYVHHYAVPNFYFHFTTAYAILRHNGVGIGKGDYLGEMPFQQ